MGGSPDERSSVATDLDEERREAVLRFTATPLVLVALGNGVMFQLEGYPQAWTLLVGGTLGAAGLVFHHVRPRSRITRHLMVAILAAVLGHHHTVHGGLGFGSSYFVGCLPLYAFLLVGARAGLVWGLVGIAQLATITAAHLSGWQPPVRFDAQDTIWIHAVSAWVQFAILAGFGAAYDWLRVAALNRLGETTRRLDGARREAERASEVKSAFLANMSHEIRTPMHGVAGTLQLLAKNPDAPERDHWIDSAQRSTLALRQILDDIIDLSKIEAGKLHIEAGEVHLAQLVEDTRGLFEAEAARKRVDMELELSDALPPLVRGDPVRVRQIVNNLASNAIKFSAPEPGRGEARGKVAIRILALPEDPEHYRIEVEDNGIGISEEAQARILRPFEQADDSTTRRFGGTGLGLAIIGRLAELMGSALSLESTPHEGSRFWVDLPLEPATLDLENEPFGEEEAARLEGMKVLVAEDNIINQSIILAMLEDLGMEVTLAPHGRYALQLLEMERFDLVLMDCQMPVMDGFEATRRLRRDHLDFGAPVLALTASALVEDRQQCLDAGMDDVLTKPIDADTLARALAHWTKKMEH